MPATNPLRQLARTAGVGRALLRYQHASLLGARRYAELLVAKRRLTVIRQARPVNAGGGSIEIHMLLNHNRLLEGMWALYSFFRHANIRAQAVIHDDGTLTDADCADLWTVIAGVRIIRRDEADRVVGSALHRRGLARCQRLRAQLPFALKLIDIPFFTAKECSIVLDSDVLFFQTPTALLETPGAAYSIDQWEPPCPCYCLPDDTLAALAGQPCAQRFNPGVMKIERGSPDLDAVESALAQPGFWPDNRPSYYAELTLWALEMTRVGASPLPRSYAIAPDDCTDPQLVAGHFCGGIPIAYSYYTQAIPLVRASLLGRH